MTSQKNFSRQTKVLAVVQEKTQASLASAPGIPSGIHAGTIAELLQMDRSNVSRELNALYRSGQLIKIQGKPTMYLCRSALSREYPQCFFPSTLPREANIQNYMDYPQQASSPNLPAAALSSLENMVGANKTLKSAILQIKAAVMYPSHNLHVLITGNIGVGKGRLVEEMFAYGIAKGSFSADAPFITVNCQEHSATPQLLLNQLFGCTRNAAIKSEKAQKGLIERAGGGMLFLNGIEKLPVKVQDVLSTLLDKNLYTRIGEASVIRHSNAMIVAVSTEAPDAPSLAALRQRFPIRIHIPDLDVWSPREIIELLLQAFQKETASIGLNFRIPKDIFAVFLKASYPGNLGDLTSTVRTTCALAFQEQVSTSPGSKTMEISLHHLPAELLQSVHENIWQETQIRQLFKALELECLTFTSNTFYTNRFVASQFIKLLHQEPEDINNNGIYISPFLSSVIHATRPYFDAINIPAELNADTFTEQFSEHLFHAARQTISDFPVFSALTDNIRGFYLIMSCLRDAAKGEIPTLDDEHFNWIRMQDICPLESACANTLCKLDGASYPDSVRIHMAICLNILHNRSKFSSIPILIVFHGNHIAEDMANYINSALGSSIATGLSVPENMLLQETLDEAVVIARRINQGQGILLAVDMEPFTHLHEYLFHTTGIHTEIVVGAALPLLLSIARFALQENVTLHELHQEIIHRMGDDCPLPRPSLLTYTSNEILMPALTFLDPNKAADTLNMVLSGILKELHIIQTDEITIKFIAHCSHMLERLIRGKSQNYNGLKTFVRQNDYLISVVEKHMSYAAEVFDVLIPLNELAYITEILLPCLRQQADP